MRRLSPTLLLALLLLLPAASASADVRAEVAGDTIELREDSGKRVNIVVGPAPVATDALRITRANDRGSDVPASLLPIAPGCLAKSSTAPPGPLLIECTTVQVKRFHFTGAERADSVIATAPAATPGGRRRPGVFDMNGGDDRVIGGPDGDVLNGGGGDDTLDGDLGSDVIHGGDGDDELFGPADADVIDGGPGVDTVSVLGVPAGGLSISLNGLPDDGPGGANVLPSVENVRGSVLDDQITGGPGPNRLDGFFGNDTINAADGAADVVDCGSGTSDRAVVDAADTVTGCELIEHDDDADGSLSAADCDDAAPAVHPGAPEIPGNGLDDDCAGGDAVPPLVDGDADGVVAPTDCDDGNAEIRPGARDVPGNRVDEDCAGGDARFPLAPARISFAFAAFRDHTELTTLVVRGVPRGGRVELRCKGRGCGFA
jgi:hypothetical protein